MRATFFAGWAEAAAGATARPLDDLVGALADGRWQLDAEGLGGLQLDESHARETRRFLGNGWRCAERLCPARVTEFSRILP
jgi:hypothetical protein